MRPPIIEKSPESGEIYSQMPWETCEKIVEGLHFTPLFLLIGHPFISLSPLDIVTYSTPVNHPLPSDLYPPITCQALSHPLLSFSAFFPLLPPTEKVVPTQNVVSLFPPQMLLDPHRKDVDVLERMQREFTRYCLDWTISVMGRD